MEEKEVVCKAIDKLNPNQKFILLMARELINDVSSESKCNNIDGILEVWWNEFQPNLGYVQNLEILKELGKQNIKIIDEFIPEVENNEIEVSV